MGVVDAAAVPALRLPYTEVAQERPKIAGKLAHGH